MIGKKVKDKVWGKAVPSYVKQKEEISDQVKKQVRDKVNAGTGPMVDHILEESKTQVRRAKLKK
ncbi:MAG: hypothetical protein KGI54_17895 [Pseudomonadota bacterium]|nr:hypothetical protein [Pseudomonadota bacterium]